MFRTPASPAFRFLLFLFSFCLSQTLYAASYQVTDPCDDGYSVNKTNTIRWAVDQANTHPGSIITFSLANSITVMAPLHISSPVTVDGTNGGQNLVLGGLPAYDVLDVEGSASGSVVHHLAVVNGSIGIAITVDNVTIQNCWIGTDWLNTGNRGNGTGILISGGSNCVIGTATGRNIISGNATGGLYVADAWLTRIQNNYFGSNSSGSAGLGNGSVLSGTGYNIALSGGGQTLVGGSSGLGNLIAASDTGVSIASPGNTLAGNVIGLNAAQTATLANNYGVMLYSASGNAIGLPLANQGNVISGNNQAGIYVGGTPLSCYNRIQNNIIGTNASGAASLGNAGYGILVNQGTANQIGGRLLPNELNCIAGNGYAGVLLSDGGNTVSGNYIGVIPAGTDVLSNGSGIELGGGNGNVIGGLNASPATCLGNLISGNDSGILQYGGDRNAILGNLIGTDPAGTASGAFANTTGIAVEDGLVAGAHPTNILIGGNSFSQRNVVAGNETGIMLVSLHTATSIQGNYIGLNSTGSAGLANTSYGIYADGLSNALVGGDASQRNYIYGDTGVIFAGDPSFGNTLTGNWIGLSPTAVKPAPVMSYGIYFQDSIGNWIGLSNGNGNLITNAGIGIVLSTAGVVNTSMFSNTICGCSTAPVYVDTASNGNKLPPSINTYTTSVISGSTSNAEDVVQLFLADGPVDVLGGSLRLLNSVTADFSGFWTMNTAGIPGITAGSVITAMSTSKYNASTDFATNRAITGPVFSATCTPTITFTPTVTRTPTATSTRTASATATPTPTASSTPTATCTRTATPTATTTATASPTRTASSTPTATMTRTNSPTRTDTATSTGTPTGSPTFTATPTLTNSATASPTPSISATTTISPTATDSATITPSPTVSPTPSISPSGTITATITLTAIPLALSGDFRASPNPGRDHVAFLFNTDSEKSVSIRIYNMTGELVAQISKVLWDCRGVAPGIYVVRITLPNGTVKKSKVAIIR
jgi:hypothetical protein